jgi:hypothetical protein
MAATVHLLVVLLLLRPLVGYYLLHQFLDYATPPVLVLLGVQLAQQV